MRGAALSVAFAAALFGSVTPPPPTAGLGDETTAVAERNAVALNARDAYTAEREWLLSSDPESLIEYQRADLCGVASGALSTPDNGACADNVGAVTVPDCDGQTPIEPLWSRERATPTSPWGPWEFRTGWSCPQDAIPAFTVEDFRRLPLAPPTLLTQPATGSVLINLPTITMARAGTQLLTTDLLGFPVEVEATATEYSWDYGDGTSVTTTSPGRPYPDHDVHHTYTSPGDYTITLTTTWSGRYRLAGSTAWVPVSGTATTSASTALTAVEARSRLVADSCDDDATC